MTRALRRPELGLAAALLLAVLWRLPFERLPITTDEAGYVTVARLWASGARLYQSTWVDRPQGLLLVFRVLASFGGSLALLRGAAVVAGVVLVLLVYAVGQEIGGRRTGIAAALVAGAFGCSPFLESFTLSGELLAAIPSTACAYCGLRWLATRRMHWLIGAGLLCGCAVLVKQSAFDAGLALALVIAFQVRRPRALLPFLAAVFAPVAIAAATAPSLHAWWTAVVAYRFQGASVVSGVSSVSWHTVWTTALPIVKGLVPLLVVAAVGVGRSPTFVRVWIATAAVGALGGGLFHAHYFFQLVPPLAVAAACARWERRSALALAVAACLAVVAALPALDVPVHKQVALIFPRDQHLVHDQAVAHAVQLVAKRHGAILVLPPTASIEYLAKRPSAIPYLWARNVETMKHAARMERRAILERRAAAIVVERQSRGRFLRSVGLSLATILENYRPVLTAYGVTVYRPRG